MNGLLRDYDNLIELCVFTRAALAGAGNSCHRMSVFSSVCHKSVLY